ncbi:MAG: hypothetical protein IGS48_23900, partial [Oscillatoriales cyanobacterium C42_A2020_001]|nr:hypothetical protein [Leptolyngbyaceae cyanobacterium C42_A2020_001]
MKDANVWSDWYQKIKGSLYDIDRRRFTPTRTVDDAGVPYRMAARVLGLVYEKLDKSIIEQLEFPLLQQFQQKLKNKQVSISQIMVLISDQSRVFEEKERDSHYCPYWQDTCLLYPILADYLQQQFPAAEIMPLLLEPESATEGLDNWNEVLALVQRKIGALTVEPETAYVSHQAGTPAISSAVQFASLAKFGDRVRFLVSNEYRPEQTGFVESSSYLRGIQIEQAKKLLERHDYSGVQALIGFHLKDEDSKVLLNAAIQWNFAKFEEFANEVEKLSSQDLQSLVQTAKDRRKNWWWEAYEAAYLGVVRLKQGNTVEAMFHSFRAVEGLLKTWSDKCHPGELKKTKHPKWQKNERWDRNLNPYGQDLYWFLTAKKDVDKNTDIKQNKTPDIFIFGSRIFDQRNELFHQLKGLKGEKEVFENWRSPNEPQWKQDS